MRRQLPVWLRVLVVALLGGASALAALVAFEAARAGGPAVASALPSARAALPVAVAVATVVCLLAALWPLLPGPAGRLQTIGWVQAVGAGVLLWSSSLTAVTLVGLTTVVTVLVDLSRGAPTLVRSARLLGLGVTVALAGAWLELWGIPPGSFAGDRSGLVLLAATGLVVLLGVVLDTGVRASLRLLEESVSWREALVEEGITSAVVGSQLLTAPVVVLALLHAPFLLVPVTLLLSAVERLGALGAVSRRDSLHDPLTGLSNRRDLERRLRTAVAAVSGAGSPTVRGAGCALLLVDLDDFKEVNDRHGHAVGDAVLKVTAQRLRQVAGRQAVVARLGGDEFAVLLTQVRDREVAEAVAHRIDEALGQPIQLREPVVGRGSVGVALAPSHAVAVAELMQLADAAMYAAKQRGGVVVHGDYADTRPESRREMVASLRTALDERTVGLVYQPQVLLQAPDRDRMHGVEALLRWNDADLGAVPPDSFIPLAEGSGLIGRLTGVVLELALDRSAQWLRQGLRVPVAVNVSLRDLEDPGFAERTARLLSTAGVPSSLLTLEVTERVLAGDLSTVGATMERLHRVGIRLSLDDFGTGWSSLLLLRRLPVDELKLDRSFVSRVALEAADEVVVRSVLGLAQELGLLTLAEGVEDERTLQVLTGLGCDAAQGYHVSPPLPACEVPAWFDGSGAGWSGSGPTTMNGLPASRGPGGAPRGSGEDGNGRVRVVS